MEQKINDVKEKVDELMQGKQEAQPETMIEQAMKLKDELSQLKEEIKAEREKLDKVHTQVLLGGKTLQGQPEKTKEELAAEEAKRILAVYGK